MFWDRIKIFSQLLSRSCRDTTRYYQRWYFKQTAWGPLSGKAARKERALVFLPGVSYSPAGDHAFIQTLDGATGSSRYFVFPISDFSFKDDPFEIRIRDNRFSLSGINLDLVDERGHLGATIRFGPVATPRKSPWKSGTMPPKAFAPCAGPHYEIVSLDHAAEGFAWIQDQADIGPPDPIIFNGGRGYIARSWGSSMPEARIWIQANDLDTSGGVGSISLNLARITVGRASFNGFICILLIGTEEFLFSNRSGAHLDLLEYEGPTIHILLSDRAHKLEVQVRRSKEGALAAQSEGESDRYVHAGADARTRVLLKRRNGATDELIYDFSALAGAMELFGDLEALRP